MRRHLPAFYKVVKYRDNAPLTARSKEVMTLEVVWVGHMTYGPVESSYPLFAKWGSEILSEMKITV